MNGPFKQSADLKPHHMEAKESWRRTLDAAKGAGNLPTVFVRVVARDVYSVKDLSKQTREDIVEELGARYALDPTVIDMAHNEHAGRDPDASEPARAT
jgi:hypothetical protein